tara:strand:+ start:122 stop:265 length:144 start_codon:yes stop_codon:yes gene_type:complete
MTTKMKIGTREIGYGHAPLVIAEIGINHGGSSDEAKQIFPPKADVSI